MSAELARNKKAFHDYEIVEDYEAGIKLSGPEVKSCRAKKIQMKGSFVSFQKGKVWLKSMHISPYFNDANKASYDPMRVRELLLHKKEAERLEQKIKEQGSTVIPLKIYLKKGLIKVKIGLARGKKTHDKRHELKKKSQNLEIKRALKNYR